MIDKCLLVAKSFDEMDRNIIRQRMVLPHVVDSMLCAEKMLAKQSDRAS